MTPGEAIQRVFEGWHEDDPAAVAALFSPQGRYEDPLFPEPLVGPDAIRDGIAPAMAEISDCRIITRRLAENGDTGIVEAEFRSALADGEGRLDFPFAMVVEMQDGLIARLTEYFDTRPFA
jgi:ketosteroid isomerase-like protein